MSKHQYAALQKAVDYIETLDAVGTLILRPEGVVIEFVKKGVRFTVAYHTSNKVQVGVTWNQIEKFGADFLIRRINDAYDRIMAKEMQAAA